MARGIIPPPPWEIEEKIPPPPWEIEEKIPPPPWETKIEKITKIPPPPWETEPELPLAQARVSPTAPTFSALTGKVTVPRVSTGVPPEIRAPRPPKKKSKSEIEWEEAINKEVGKAAQKIQVEAARRDIPEVERVLSGRERQKAFVDIVSLIPASGATKFITQPLKAMPKIAQWIAKNPKFARVLEFGASGVPFTAITTAPEFDESISDFAKRYPGEIAQNTLGFMAFGVGAQLAGTGFNKLAFKKISEKLPGFTITLTPDKVRKFFAIEGSDAVMKDASTLVPGFKELAKHTFKTGKETTIFVPETSAEKIVARSWYQGARRFFDFPEIQPRVIAPERPVSVREGLPKGLPSPEQVTRVPTRAPTPTPEPTRELKEIRVIEGKEVPVFEQKPAIKPTELPATIPTAAPVEAKPIEAPIVRPEAAKPQIEPVSAIPKELEPLAQEARKYKSAEEFVEAVTEDRGGVGYPDYAPAKRLVETGINDTPLTNFGFKPTDKVTIWRGVDNASQKDIQAGDYIATSKELAQTYTGGKVISKEVPASTVRFASGDGITAKEFEKGFNQTHLEGVYNPNPLIPKSQLTDFYNQAVKGKQPEPTTITTEQLKALEKKPAREKPAQGIVSFVISRGRINPNKSESSDIRELGRPDLMDTKNGKSLDDMIMDAIESGYLPEGSTGSDLIALLDKEIKTKKKQLPISEIGLEEELRPLEEMNLEMINREIKEINEKLGMGKLKKKEQQRLANLIDRKQDIEEFEKFSKAIDEIVERPEEEPLTEAVRVGGEIQEQTLIPGTPQREFPRTPVPTGRKQVEQERLLEEFRPEVEQPKLFQNQNQRIAKVLRESKSSAEAQKRLKEEFGIEISMAELKKIEPMIKGGGTPDLTDKVVVALTEEIKKEVSGIEGADYGTEKLADIDPKDLMDSIKFSDIAKEKLFEVGEKIKHFANSLELPQVYLYHFEDSKPIAEGIIDTQVKMLRERADITRFLDKAKRVTNKNAFAKIIVDADRDNKVNIFAELEKAVKEGRITKSDKEAFTKGLYYLHKYARDKLIEDILDSRLGVRLKSKGLRYMVEYTKKDGTTAQRWVTARSMPSLQRRFRNVNVLDQKEEIILRRRDPQSGGYKEKFMRVDSYEDALKELPKEEKSLVDEILPFRNYIPHNRRGGKYWVEVFEKLADGSEQKIFSARVPNKTYAEQMKKQISEKFPVGRVELKKHSFRMKTQPSFGTMADVQVFLNQNGIDPRSEAGQRIINAYRSMSPLMSHLIHSQNLAGFRVDWEGIVEGMETLAKSANTRSFRNGIKDLRDLLPNIKDDFRHNVAFKYLDALVNTSENSPVLDGLRSLGYFWVLGNKPTYIVQNISEPLWAVARLPELNKPTKFIEALGKEYTDLIKQAEKEGVLSPLFVYEKESKTLLENLNILGNASEQWSSRKVFEVGLRVARDKGMVGDEAYKYAYQFLFNVGKPFYNKANKPIFTLGAGWESVRRHGFMFLNWMLDFINKTARGNTKTILRTVLGWWTLAGIGTFPLGKELLEKTGMVDKKKHPKDYTAFDRFLLGGLAGAVGADPKFLVPLFFKGLKDAGSAARGAQILADKMKRSDMAWNRDGLIGLAGELPLGGIQYYVGAQKRADEGFVDPQTKKRIFKPETIGEQIITRSGLTPFEVGEYYRQRKEKRETKKERKKSAERVPVERVQVR